MSRKLLAIHLVIIIFLIGIFSFFLSKINLLNQTVEDQNMNKTYIFNNQTTVELIKIDKGELEVEDAFCKTSDGCTVDLKISISPYIENLLLDNYVFGGGLDIPEIIPNSNTDEDIKYLRISSGTGNERGTTIFNNSNSERYKICTTGKAYILNSRYLFYNDCGSVGKYIELVQGISTLDLETGEISKVIQEKSGSQEVSYRFENIVEDQLIYYEDISVFDEVKDELKNQINVRSLDLSEYF